MPGVMFQGLTRRFGAVVALAGAGLTVPQGRVFGYLGLNGAGKTTTIRILAGLQRATSGAAVVDDVDVIREPHALRGKVGFVGDEAADSQPSWSPREYLGYFAALQGLRPRRSHAEAALSLVGVEPSARRRRMGTLSTGTRRRVELARALLGAPRVLLLDEPTRGLDLPAKREVWQLLRRLSRERGVTIFLSSHDVMEILALCEDVAVLRRGQIVFQGHVRTLGSTADLLERSLIALLRPSPS